ncbi:MAG: hypothetical protein H8E64_09175 [Candidatus Marinimicrobia bacterium]|nr:hypothetical protein [Candidatus Neomarinimicrobiota bacterium]
MRKEKRDKICLVPARHLLFISIVAGGKAENVVTNGIMDKISNAKQGRFNLLNLPAL